MEVVIREPRAGDAAGLAQAARDLGEQYGAVEPDRFQIPGAALLDWLAQALQEPVSVWTVRLLAAHDTLPIVRFTPTSRMRFRVEDVERFAESSRRHEEASG